MMHDTDQLACSMYWLTCTTRYPATFFGYNTKRATGGRDNNQDYDNLWYVWCVCARAQCQWRGMYARKGLKVPAAQVYTRSFSRPV